MQFPQVKIAAVHAAPAFLDAEATIDKLASLTAQAAAQDATVVAFGESFVSGYPIWNGVMPPTDTHDLHEALVRSSVEVPGKWSDHLAQIARDNGVVLSVGINEIASHSSGQIFNANLIFDASGQLVNHRRKLVATWYERLTWSHGDGHDLKPVELDGMNLGVLICGENTNPLAKYALTAQGEQLHIATYPPAWPFDSRPSSVDYDLTESIKIRSASHCFEGKVFALVPATALDEESLEHVAPGNTEIQAKLRNVQSSSMIIGPRGETLAGPVIGGDQILYADVDLSEAITLKRAQDVAGTYNRFDVFALTLNTRRHTPITISGDAAEVADSETGEVQL